MRMNDIRLLKSRIAKKLARNKLSSIKLTESDIAIDCGANIGDITYRLSLSGARVFAFEPNPYAYEILRDRFQERRNVTCIQKGVLDRNDTVRLFLHRKSKEDQVHWSTGSSLLDFKGNVDKDSFIEIEVIDLCEFIESLDAPVKVLKMDVEGVECRIVKKLIHTGLIYRIDHVFVETHGERIPKLKAETEELKALLKQKRIRHVNLNWT